MVNGVYLWSLNEIGQEVNEIIYKNMLQSPRWTDRETDKPTSQIYSPKHYSFEGTDIVRQEDHDGPISLT